MISLVREVCNLGASITIVASLEPLITPLKLNRRELKRVFGRVYTILRKLKHRRGGLVYIDGEVVRVC
ncbi:MAG: hypothetical protein F7B59_02155 [Desulfurococcales archaeon]|nr:hypothetical protein [Desulfurococcales archaeon]